MQNRAFKRFVAMARWIVGASAITAATYQPLPISTLVDHASTYDRHSVFVTGTVNGFATYTDLKGKKYLLFDLCDHSAKCVHVYAWGQSHVIDGASKTVRGTFWMTRSVDRHTVHNELDAAEGSP